MSAFLEPVLRHFDVLTFPIAALSLFVAVFSLVIVRARRLGPDEASQLAAMPLSDDSREP